MVIHFHNLNLFDKINEKSPENFEKNQKIGENENCICLLIRNDLIVKFKIYVNKTNYPLKSEIQNKLI